MHSVDNTHHVSSNKESGFGRYDICLLPKHNMVPYAWLLEFKVADGIKSLDTKVKEGMQQIADKEYTAELKAHNCSKYICVSIAFHKKHVKYQYKIIEDDKIIKASEII